MTVSDDDVIKVSRSLTIPVSELRWRFTASGGPGGQHANTANTKVELRFDIERSPSLGPRQRERLLERYGPEVRVVASSERSQTRNRSEAMERLAELLAAGLHIERPRVATRPGRGAVKRRLEDKGRRSATKRDRQRPGTDHD
jgi:ribosome-associated protein